MTEPDVHEYRIGRRGWLRLPLSILELGDVSPLWIPLALLIAFREVSRSYLRVSPAGLELFYSSGLELFKWTNYQLQVGWDQVDHIEQRKVLFSTCDVLCLKEKASLGSRTMHGRVLGWGPQRFISLSDFEGWPAGKLAEDLRRFAPQLFAAELEKGTR